MTGYAIRRLLAMIPVLLLLVFAIVLFARLADTDVIDILLQEQAANTVSRHDMEARLGIDKSMPEAYLSYLADLTRGDLGESLLGGRPVWSMIKERLNITLELAMFSLVVGWVVGSLIGVASAMRQNSIIDYLLRGFAILGLTIPNFAVATAVILLPAIYWQWTPPLSYTKLAADPVGHLSQFILPVLVLAFALMGIAMRITRTQMLETLRQDYIRTARAKGLNETTVIVRHAFRNALIPIVSVMGLQVAAVMSGTVIIESIFALPGIGRLLIESINNKDWPIVQGITLIVGVWVMLINLVVDLSYGLIDPHLRVRGKS